MPDENPMLERANRRIVLLADRLAILLVVAKNKYGDDWSPWFAESMWQDEGALGEVLREWPEYQTANRIIKHWIRKMEQDEH